MLKKTMRSICQSAKCLSAGAIFLIAVSCNKGVPVQMPCGCEPDTLVSYGKGAIPSKELSPCGTLHLPIDTSLGNATIVTVGIGNRLTGLYNLPELRPNGDQVFVLSTNLQVNAHAFLYYVNADISDLKGNPLVQIKENKWYVYKNNVGKYNYDAKGFEVFDKAGRIVISLDSKPYAGDLGPTLNVQGVIPQNASTLNFYSPISQYPITEFAYGTPALNKTFDSIYKQYPIPALFRYTGKDWQHARL